MKQKVPTPVAIAILVVALAIIGFVGWKVFFAPPPPLPAATVINEDREGPEHSPMTLPQTPGMMPPSTSPPEAVSGAPSTNR